MLRKMAVLALFLVVGGCGGGQEEADELKSYVAQMQQMDGMNHKVNDFIMRLDQPSYDITAADLDEARKLVDDYITTVENLPQPEYDELRRAYNNYVRKLVQAKDLAVDTGHELRRERGNVAIAMRHIEKMTVQHYQSAIDLLWIRQNLPGEMPLKWPD